ncbi:MAG: HAD hydrolase family protein, partial [Chlamydiales bacterium]|nr:HAD hydrolase family protein [Chlamydiales bacterium]
GQTFYRCQKKKRLFQRYLGSAIIKRLDSIYQDIKEDYIIYAGLERGDCCIYRESRFSSNGKDYLSKLKKLTREDWQVVDDFQADKDFVFPMIKCFGSLKDMEKINQALLEEEVSCFIIKDVIDSSQYLALITAQEVDKGSALDLICRYTKNKGPIIAAGDDNNDLPLRSKSDVFIAMHSAPDALKVNSIIVDKNSNIITALKQAIARC